MLLWCFRAFPARFRSSSPHNSNYPQDRNCRDNDQSKTEYENPRATSQKGAQRSTFAHVFLKGSYTLEAAIALPVFIMALAAILVFFPAEAAEASLRSALESVGRRFSAYYYAVEEIEAVLTDGTSGKTEEDRERTAVALQSALSSAAGSILWYPVASTLVKERVESELGNTWAGDALVEEGISGIDYLGSRYDEAREGIVLTANYSLKVPFALFSGIRIPISVRTFHRVWSGKEMREGNGTEEELVYITATGTVYHTALSCTHLSLSIQSVDSASVGSLRNESGGRYQKCAFCGSGSGASVFITRYGTNYHFNRNCSGLKRDISSVPRSAVSDRPLCQRCREREGK